jgi:Na+-driven multidrug efflux pump
VTGLNIYASSFFTSLNNGPVSALISMSRTIIFECGCVLLLPLIFGMEGIWWAVVVAECLSAILSIVLLLTHRSRYGYHFLNLSV